MAGGQTGENMRHFDVSINKPDEDHEPIDYDRLLRSIERVQKLPDVLLILATAAAVTAAIVRFAV
jgi:hypothetical protein